jgi:hypothetical protein
LGDADNAVIRSILRPDATELIDRRRWTTRVELANAALRDWRSSTTGNDATAR